jgi:DNA polymerase
VALQKRPVGEVLAREGVVRASTKRPTSPARRTAFEGAERYVPGSRNLGELSRAVQKCRGCDLYRDATQAVFGEGSSRARPVLVGEQPGDQEDLQGHPFVGPAGALLDRALAEAKISRRDVFVTNAVKHFKFERTPKRRIHQTPTSGEVQACRPYAPKVLATYHPSAALRADGDAGRERIYGLLVRDLRKAASAMQA